MEVSLKLVSLNVEHSKHINSSIEFLSSRQCDVVCLQELFERDVERVAEALGSAAYRFVPMTRHGNETPPEPMGVGIFSRLDIVFSETKYYRGGREAVPVMNPKDAATFNHKNQMVLFCDIEKEGIPFRFGVTHFTWSPDGAATDLQRNDMTALLRLLGAVKDFVLCGDFNAPRGGEIYSMLAGLYKDNVPQEYTTSIDGELHRRGQLNLMVDSIFSMPAYKVSGVELVSGVSDHCALLATVSRTG